MRAKPLFFAAPLLALALATGSAQAEPAGAALRLYAAGDYVAAADAASGQDTSSLTFVSQALMAACVTTRDRSQIAGWLNRAEESALTALANDPQSVDARMQLALVYGVRGRQASIAEAITRRYAPRGKRLIQEALALAPNNARVHALMGAWHLEVLRRGGRAGAVAYGARLDEGMREFDRARALAPNDPMISLQYAVALIQLNPDRYAPQAAQLLDASAAARPQDTFEAQAQQNGRRISRALTERGPQAAARTARAAFL